MEEYPGSLAASLMLSPLHTILTLPIVPAARKLVTLPAGVRIVLKIKLRLEPQVGMALYLGLLIASAWNFSLRLWPFYAHQEEEERPFR